MIAEHKRCDGFESSLAIDHTNITIQSQIDLLEQLKLSPNSIMTEMINRNISELKQQLK